MCDTQLQIVVPNTPEEDDAKVVTLGSFSDDTAPLSSWMLEDLCRRLDMGDTAVHITFGDSWMDETCGEFTSSSERLRQIAWRLVRSE